jgi:hypothetical protein
MTKFYRVLIALFIAASSFAFAQNIGQAFHWDTQCQEKGCMLFLDVLHGAAGEASPPDPKDSKQYISLMVAIDRETRKLVYLAFHLPPDADPKQGFFVAFASDRQSNGQVTIEPDKASLMNLGFDSCDADSCIARLREGKVDDGKGGLIDLLQGFNEKDHLWLMYTRKGKPIRTMIPLVPYRTAYRHVLDVELAPQK